MELVLGAEPEDKPVVAKRGLDTKGEGGFGEGLETVTQGEDPLFL